MRMWMWTTMTTAMVVMGARGELQRVQGRADGGLAGRDAWCQHSAQSCSVSAVEKRLCKSID